jgi:hypothetical protein
MFSCDSVVGTNNDVRISVAGEWMRGLLVRVGIDMTTAYGGWNAPVNTVTRRFMFVPIQDRPYNDGTYVENGRRVYHEEVTTALANFAVECGDPAGKCFRLPVRLHNEPMHLDPDFLRLTYGDDSRRGRILKQLEEDDFIAFYSSLKPLDSGKLVYALIGIFVLAGTPLGALQIPDVQRLCNAHMRWRNVKETDIVAFGKEEDSGMFERCVPIGEFRERAYRVREDVLEEWGDISVKNGWLQRSANLPEFKNPTRFRNWLVKQDVRMARAQYQVSLLSTVAS